MMQKALTIAISLFIGISSFSQKSIVAVYDFFYKTDTFNKSKHLLAIDDSIAFSTIILNRDKEYKPKEPLGSGFQSHDTYINLAKNLRLSQSEPYGRGKYLITDTVEKLDWQSAEGEKEILGHVCKKAAAQKGQTIWVVWYAPDLPFSFAPFMATGLPGLALELINVTSHQTYRAIKLEEQSVKIIEPTKGKKITVSQFHKLLDKLRQSSQ